MAEKKIVPLSSYPNEMEASLVAQILDESGIPAYVKPMGGGYGVLGVTPFFHHRVYVYEDQLEEAREIAGVDPDEITEDSPETSAP